MVLDVMLRHIARCAMQNEVCNVKKILWTLDTCLIHIYKFCVLHANAECQIWSHMTL